MSLSAIISKIKKSVIHFVRTECEVKAGEYFWSFFSSFAGIGLIATIQNLYFNQLDNVFLIGSFGASSVLVFGAAKSPLAHARNLFGGHILSAIIGVSVNYLFPDMIYFSAPLAVSLSILVMQSTKTIHPPGGATALIAVIGSEQLKDLGYIFVLFPVFSGALILYFVAKPFRYVHPRYSYLIKLRLIKVFSSKMRNPFR